MSQGLRPGFLQVRAGVSPHAAKLCRLASLNSPNILTQRLFSHRSDFAPVQNALPTVAKLWSKAMIRTIVQGIMQDVGEGVIRIWNAVLVKSGYRFSERGFSERDPALQDELSAARFSSPPRATVFEV
jgi:hypothetical protein